jgi:hypothetical protein
MKIYAKSFYSLKKETGVLFFLGAVEVEQRQTYIYLQIASDTFAE